jgi:hypothetical protein
VGELLTQELVILGKGPSWAGGIAKAKEHACELWTLNNAWRRPEVAGLATSVFELHKWAGAENALYREYNPVGQLQVPVFMQERYQDVPCSVAYPLAEMEALFGVSYWTNTVAYMLSLAISRKRYRRIHLFGIDYLDGRAEREFERPCTEYWIGQAMARGIAVTLPKSSAIFTATEQGERFRYGYDRRLRESEPAFQA